MSTPASILKNENQGRTRSESGAPAPPVNPQPAAAVLNRDPTAPPPPPVNPQPAAVQRPVSSQHKPLPPTMRPNKNQYPEPEEYEDVDDEEEEEVVVVQEEPVSHRKPQPPTMRQPPQQAFQPARPTLPGRHMPQIPEDEAVQYSPPLKSALKNSQLHEDGDDEVGIRNRVNSPQFQSVNLRSSEGLRSPASLKASGLMASTDSVGETVVYDARNHPQAHFARVLEQYTSNHKKAHLHALKVIKIPVVEQKELRIKSYSESQILETPLSISADIYTAIAYGIYGDSTLGNDVRLKMIDLLRDLADWLEDSDRPDIGKVLDGMEIDDLGILFKYLVLDDEQAPGGGGGGGDDGDGAAGPSGASSLPGASTDKRKITEQGMVEEKKRKTRVHQIARDAARNQLYARSLRQMSNDISSFDGKQGAYIHPLSLVALGAMMYSRTMYLFSVKPGQIKLHSITPPRPGKRLPVYLACDEKDTAMIYMMVPQKELHTFEENQLFFQRHVMDCVALVPAYNEGEEEIMRTFLSFKKECKEEVQVIFFVDGVKKNGSDVNHNTLQALLKNFDFIKMGETGPLARFGKDDLQALVADVMTIGDAMNETAVYQGQDRVDAVAHIALRVWIKKNNSGKKQSQLKFFEYLNQRSIQPRYLLFVDSDTRFEHPAVSGLRDALDLANTGKIVPEIGGTTGEIVVENLSAGFFILGATQYFEYKMSHHLGKRAESSFGRVSCLAGAFSMFECRALMDPRVIGDFSKDDNHNSIWEYNKKNLGEDRYLTAQLLEAGYGTSFEPGSLSHTVAPSSLKGFIAQRRRWDNSTLVNQVDLIFANKESVFSLWGGRYTLPWIWNFIDFVFTLVMPGNMILLLVSVINSILRLSHSTKTVSLIWYAPVFGVGLWIVFFLLPFLSKNPHILDLDLYILKLVCACVVSATILLFAYIFSTNQSVLLVVIAVWVFLGPYAFTLIIRAEIVCMLCGPLFLFMTPVMFLFLKFYALANFGERSWGTRDAAAKKDTEKEQINTRFAICFAGIVYLIINIAYMIVALKFPLYFMWVFSLLVSITAITRLVASLALSNSLNTFRRKLGTVGMFDGLCAVAILIAFRILYDYDLTVTHPTKKTTSYPHTYAMFYSGKEVSIFFIALIRSFIISAWYLGMRRSGWIVYGIGALLTVIQGALVLILHLTNAYGALMAISAIIYTMFEGYLVWRTNTHKEKDEDKSGLCCYLAYGHNLGLLLVATIFYYLPSSNLEQAQKLYHASIISATAPIIFFAVIAGIWMYVLHFFRPRAWVLVMNAVTCNFIYLVVLIVCGQTLLSGGNHHLDSFATGYYPYVAILSMIFQLLLSWSAVRWAVRLKAGISAERRADRIRGTVDTKTGERNIVPATV